MPENLEKIRVVKRGNFSAEPFEETIYIGRGSPLGNPFDWRGSKHPSVKYQVGSRDEAIDQYEAHLLKSLKDGEPEICNAINQLIIYKFQGTHLNLECFCHPEKCHGDIIKKIVEDSKYCINWFSNMRPLDRPIKDSITQYLTVENFYQAMKSTNRDERIKISKMSPYKAKSYARTMELRSDWEDIKLDVMRYALVRKFAEGTSWHEKLKRTEGPIIEWNNWGDKFWGKCVFTGEGLNHLGLLIEELR